MGVASRVVGAAVLLAVVTACSTSPRSEPNPSPAGLPTPDHTVIVVLENHSYADIIGSSDAPYINNLASSGALFTASFAVTHPSEPNYLALFSGSTQGITDDSCPHTFSTPNLAQALAAGGHTFVGYSESMPSAGYRGCTSGPYARKHNPWVNFPAIPAASNQPFTAFPRDFSKLPTVAFVVPNLDHDMHDGTVADGDRWLATSIGSYARWAATHNSLLILTWDEDDRSQNNQIPTIVLGAHVAAGRYGERIDHYRVLRTVEDLHGVAPTGLAARAEPITDIWTR